MKRIPALHFLLVFIFLIVGTNPSLPSYALDRETSQHFYSKWSDICDTSQDQQLLFLETFISNHPHFEPAYSTLLERYLISDNLDQVQHVFENLTADPKFEQHALWMLAKIYQLNDQPDSAHVYYEQAIQTEHVPLTLVWDYIEFDNRHKNRYQALEAFQQIKQEYLNTAARASYALATFRIDKAVKLFEELYQNDSTPEHYYHYCRAVIQRDESELSTRVLSKGKEIFRTWGHLYYESLITSYLSLVSAEKNQDSLALEYADEALVLAQRINNYYAMATAHYYRGKALQGTGNPSTKTALQESYNLYSTIRVDRKAANAAYYLARYLSNNASFIEAFRYANICSDIYETLNIPYYSIYAFKLKAEICKQISMRNMEEYYYRKALALAREHSYTTQIETFEAILAAHHLYEFEPHKAKEVISNNIEIARSQNLYGNELHWYHELAKYFEAKAMPEEALEYFKIGYQKAQEYDRAEYITWFLVPLGGLYAQQGDTSKAIAYLNTAVESLKGQPKKRIKAWAFLEFGTVYEELHHLDKAIYYYNQAIQTYESFRDSLNIEDFRIGSFSERQESYQRLSECYFQSYLQNPTVDALNEIFRAEELTFARSLKDILTHPSLYNTIQDSLLRDPEYRSARQQLIERQLQLRERSRDLSPAQWDSLMLEIEKAKYEFILRRIDAYLQHVKQAPVERASPDLQDVQRLLKRKRQSIVLYHISPRSAYAMAINADSVKAISLDTDQYSLESAIDSLMRPMHQVDEYNVSRIPFHSQIAYELYQTLFEPIEQQFPLHDAVLVLTSPVIANLPFDLLLTQSPDKPMYTPTDEPVYADDFLLHEYQFHYSPTTLTLDLLQHKRHTPRLLVFADPFRQEDYIENKTLHLRLRTGWTFSPLPYSDLEALQIQSLAKHCDVFMDSLATETKLSQTAPQYNVLHIASHAFVDTLFDAFSGLILHLEEDSQRDGILMGYEIAEHAFPYDLVTLSACETGRGKLVHGEGVLGLPRQFLIAGTKSILMSHWKVDDKFTSEFMPKFYHHYLHEKRSKPEALQQTKMEVLKNGSNTHGLSHQHPFFWASFSLYGDAGSAQSRSWPLWVFFLIGFLGLSIGIALGYRQKRKGARSDN